MAKYLMLLLLVTTLCTRGHASGCDKSVSVSYINGDMYMMAKSKFSFSGRPKDCADLYLMGNHGSGVYTVWPANRLFDDQRSLEVYCDMETNGGGWTVIQRRGNFGNPDDYFYKDWDDYKVGFGNRSEEFWLGNDNIYALTNQKLYTARIELMDKYMKTAAANYDNFWIDDENKKYTLHIAGYTGTAGDFMSRHNNQKFSTRDQENDEQKDNNSCASVHIGAWWVDSCSYSNLNALSARGKLKNSPVGVNWLSWRRFRNSLNSTEIKIRPDDYEMPSPSWDDSV